MQIRMNQVAPDNLPVKKSILKKRDEIFMFFGGLENIDWKNKDMDTCFEKLIVGVSPLEILLYICDPTSRLNDTGVKWGQITNLPKIQIICINNLIFQCKL